MDPILEQVLGALRSYYDAFTRCDLPGTMAWWSDRDDVSCVAPLLDPAVGPDGVEDLYRRVFEIVGHEEFSFEVLATAMEDPMAIVTCSERSENVAHGHVNEFLASNVFLLGCGGWRLVHRHVSWRAAREVQMGLP